MLVGSQAEGSVPSVQGAILQACRFRLRGANDSEERARTVTKMAMRSDGMRLQHQLQGRIVGSELSLSLSLVVGLIPNTRVNGKR